MFLLLVQLYFAQSCYSKYIDKHIIVAWCNLLLLPALAGLVLLQYTTAHATL